METGTLRRRSFLVSLGVTGLAGCLDGDDGDIDEPDGDESNGDEEEPNETDADGADTDADEDDEEDEDDATSVDDHIDDALAALRNAESTLGAEIEGFDGATDHVDFRTDAIERDLGNAEDALDEAEENADPDQQERIDDIRDTIAWIRALTETLDALGHSLDEFEVAMDYWDVERYADATDRIREAETSLEEARSRHTVAVDRFERVDGTDLDLELIEDARSDMTELKDAIDGLEPLYGGTREMSLGFEAFLGGLDAFSEERWDTAANDLDQSRSRFHGAEDRFRDGEETAPVDMRSDFISLTCMSGYFADAAGHYRDAANAADDGDWDAFDASIDAGEAALEDAEECEL